MKTKSIVTFAFLFHWTASCLFGASAVVTNLSYSQRKGTKLVDINYKLNLTAGDNAEVRFLFSHDDGRSFPVACSSVSGDVGKVHSSGVKRVVWDAGKDWNLKFTDRGRLKIVWEIHGGKPPIDFDVVGIPFKSSEIIYSPSKNLKDFYLNPSDWIPPTRKVGVPKKYFVDKWEITNFQWDKVVEWARGRGYDLEKSPAGADPNLPRVNIGMIEVVKWLNARSEMEGKTPVFYVDPDETMWDVNGNGRIDLGPDSCRPPYNWEGRIDPSFDWNLVHPKPNPIPREEDVERFFDPNMNCRWDSGEPFVDRNRNKRFEPQEYADINGNGSRDVGLTIPCRTGDISAWFKNPNPDPGRDPGMGFDGGMWLWDIMMHVKASADGYRLPMGRESLVVDDPGWGGDEFRFLALGGRTEQGEFRTWQEFDPVTGRNVTKSGIRYVEEWPWGSQPPIAKPDIDQYAVTPYGKNRAVGPLPIGEVGERKPNGYQLRDMLGNVAEMSMDWFFSFNGFGPHPAPGVVNRTLGGSWQGVAGLFPRSEMGKGEWSQAVGEFRGSPNVGFRAISIQF